MKLHIVGTANRRISNIEPQNVEGWNPKRCSGIDVFSMMSPGRPELINRMGYEKWEASGRTSLLQRAQQKRQQILYFINNTII